MSDSFADLWNATAPVKSTSSVNTNSNKTLAEAQRSSAISSVLTHGRAGATQQPDRFAALLAASGSSRTNSPAFSSTTRQSPGILSPQQRATPSSSSSPANVNANDAFSTLLSGSFSRGASANASTMSLADRQAAALREQAAVAQARKREADSVWSGLDLIGGTSSTASTSTNAAQANGVMDDDLWDFGTKSGEDTKASAPAIQPVSTTGGVIDDWDLGDFSSPAAPQPSQEQVTKGSASPFDVLDDQVGSSQASLGASGVNTPGDFDFGNREDLLNGDDSSGDEHANDDDLLGVLGKPMQPKPQRAVELSHHGHPPHLLPQASRKSSPPPHIIGQLVEMGFGIEESRAALAATDSGVDVQQALESLLAASQQGEVRTQSPAYEQNGADYRAFDDGEDSRHSPPRSDRQAPPSTSSSRPRDQRSTASRLPSQLQNLPLSPEVQDRASELLNQASEFGLSVFNRANAFWKEGKQKVQKVYEERSASSGSSRGQGRQPGDGRPKWMTDAIVDREHGGHHEVAVKERFSDGHDDPSTLEDFSDHRKEAQPRERSAPARPQASVRTANLFDDEPAAYVSPARRRGPPSRSNAPPAASSRPPPRAPSPPPLRVRECVSASSTVIATSASHKARGTGLFKLGQYAEAVSYYTKALDALPERHLLRIPLLTNRALARIRTGDHRGAHEDCSLALDVIGPDYHPAREKKVERPEEGAEVDLKEGYVKALRRRAEAAEGREKWDEALADWERLSALDWASPKTRSEAGAAAARCRKLVKVASGAVDDDPAPVAKPKPKPKQSTPATSALASLVEPSGEAVSALRASNAAAESEDALRHELKDRVDARLSAWRAGKETNIRALLASLDLVLWPELGWVKVGMGELISEKQVKIRYTKAIAKLHPDKLMQGTTLEQRMIANGVFSTLNDAWNAFKQ